MLNLTASTQKISLHLMKLRGQNTIAVVHNYGMFVVHVPLSQQFIVCPKEYDARLRKLCTGMVPHYRKRCCLQYWFVRLYIYIYIYIHFCTIRVRLSVALFKYHKTTLNCNPYTCSLKIYATSYVF